MLSQVPFPCTSVLPISLYQIPGPLHALLRGYKEDRPEALHHATWLGLLLTAFLQVHGPCLAGPLGWEELVVVPSTRGHRAPHPLESALRQALWWERAPSCTPLIPPALDSTVGPGPKGRYPPGPAASDPVGRPTRWPSTRLVPSGAPVGHTRADHRAFVVTGSVARRRILLVDDTWTTGARAESAASALCGAGAVVVGIVVVGRVVEPRAGQGRKRAWWQACGRPFDPGHCAAESAALGAEERHLHAEAGDDAASSAV